MASSRLPDDHPKMIAWEAFKASEDFTNAKMGIAHPQYVDGSLWAVFDAGWQARQEALDAVTRLGDLTAPEAVQRAAVMRTACMVADLDMADSPCDEPRHAAAMRRLRTTVLGSEKEADRA